MADSPKLLWEGAVSWRKWDEDGKQYTLETERIRLIGMPDGEMRMEMVTNIDVLGVPCWMGARDFLETDWSTVYKRAIWDMSGRPTAVPDVDPELETLRTKLEETEKELAKRNSVIDGLMQQLEQRDADLRMLREKLRATPLPPKRIAHGASRPVEALPPPEVEEPEIADWPKARWRVLVTLGENPGTTLNALIGKMGKRGVSEAEVKEVVADCKLIGYVEESGRGLFVLPVAREKVEAKVKEFEQRSGKELDRESLCI